MSDTVKPDPEHLRALAKRVFRTAVDGSEDENEQMAALQLAFVAHGYTRGWPVEEMVSLLRDGYAMCERAEQKMKEYSR